MLYQTAMLRKNRRIPLKRLTTVEATQETKTTSISTTAKMISCVLNDGRPEWMIIPYRSARIPEKAITTDDFSAGRGFSNEQG